MPSDFCLIKDGVVGNIIVSDAEFNAVIASQWDSIVARPAGLPVGIGHKYHDDKFWKDVADVCPGGMIHDGQETECPGGELLSTTHEEEIA